jgi:hypothetical protein
MNYDHEDFDDDDMPDKSLHLSHLLKAQIQYKDKPNMEEMTLSNKLIDMTEYVNVTNDRVRSIKVGAVALIRQTPFLRAHCLLCPKPLFQLITSK